MSRPGRRSKQPRPGAAKTSRSRSSSRTCHKEREVGDASGPRRHGLGAARVPHGVAHRVLGPHAQQLRRRQVAAAPDAALHRKRLPRLQQARPVGALAESAVHLRRRRRRRPAGHEAAGHAQLLAASSSSGSRQQQQEPSAPPRPPAAAGPAASRAAGTARGWRCGATGLLDSRWRGRPQTARPLCPAARRERRWWARTARPQPPPPGRGGTWHRTAASQAAAAPAAAATGGRAGRRPRASHGRVQGTGGGRRCAGGTDCRRSSAGCCRAAALARRPVLLAPHAAELREQKTSKHVRLQRPSSSSWRSAGAAACGCGAHSSSRHLGGARQLQLDLPPPTPGSAPSRLPPLDGCACWVLLDAVRTSN